MDKFQKLASGKGYYKKCIECTPAKDETKVKTKKKDKKEPILLLLANFKVVCDDLCKAYEEGESKKIIETNSAMNAVNAQLQALCVKNN